MDSQVLRSLNSPHLPHYGEVEKFTCFPRSQGLYKGLQDVCRIFTEIYIYIYT